MTELERALELLGEKLDVPATPPLAALVRERIARRRRRRLVVALALPVAALAVAFGVPQARSAILRFLHIGAVKVERVETLPPASHVAPTSGLGPKRSRVNAERVAGFRAQLGELNTPRTWWARPGLAATRLPTDPRVLLVELAGDQLGIAKKFTTADVAATAVGGSFALWIRGAHVLGYESRTGPPASITRFSGNALIWARNGITYRLEGERTLTAALRDAGRITP
jgi:hypothetical protein